jgi:hypothetical protein
MAIHLMPALRTEHAIPNMTLAGRAFVEPAAVSHRVNRKRLVIVITKEPPIGVIHRAWKRH